MPAAIAMSARGSDRSTASRVKICGVTCLADALLALDLGADLVGLNFYPPSPRYLAPPEAAGLVRSVRRERPEHGMAWVGVFVDEDVQRVAGIAETVGLDLVQLHGDEEPAAWARADEVAPGLLARVVKAFRVRPDAGGEEIHRQLERRIEPWRALGVWGFLVDTLHEHLYGGTGKSWDFGSLAGGTYGGPRLLVAGGLSPDNVRDALDACRPWGIDLCSGVESAPGRKDAHLMRRLFEEIHHGTTRPAT